MKLNRILVAFACSTLVAAASAVCAPPSKPGAVLCFPTANATVNSPFNLEGAATGDSGFPIAALIVYIDNQKAYEFTNTDTFVQDDSIALVNGRHHVVLNAWDSDKHLFQASAYFTYITGINGVYSQTCSQPASGIHLCLPLGNTAYPEIIVPFSAHGSSAIKTINVYVNGQLHTSFNTNSAFLGGNLAASATPYKYTIVGYDAAGKSIATASVTGVLTYYDGACIRNCDPGITISSPPTVTDQSSPLKISAEVNSNPRPITTMRVYLDNTAVLNSTGPGISGSVPASPGTHLVTVEAWDTEKVLYKTQETVNMQ